MQHQIFMLWPETCSQARVLEGMPQRIGRSSVVDHQVCMQLRRRTTKRSAPAARVGAPHLLPGGGQGPEGEGCGPAANPPSSSPGPALWAAAAAPSLLRAPLEATPPSPSTPRLRTSRQMHTSLRLQCRQLLISMSDFSNFGSTSNAEQAHGVKSPAVLDVRRRQQRECGGAESCSSCRDRRLLHLQQDSAAIAAVKSRVGLAAEARPQVAGAAEARPRVSVVAEAHPCCAGAPSGPRC